MTANMLRRKKVPYADFVKGFKAGCNDGLSATEIAEKLGMALPSMISRASDVRSQAAKIGKYFPSPAGGEVSALDRKKAKVELLASLLDDIEDDEKTEDESVE